MLGKLIINDKGIGFYDPNKVDLVRQVSIREPIVYDPITKKSSIISNDLMIKELNNKEKTNKTVVLIDGGVKYNIIRNLLKRDLTVIRVPYDYDFFKFSFNGIVVSNGPGDPKMCDRAIGYLRKAIVKEIPTLGICLGNQLLALAAGANTYKLKYGHRSQNQPCLEVGTKRCYITSQNHGFAVDEASLPSNLRVTHKSLFDDSLQGIHRTDKPAFSFQGHPEASPGPHDAAPLFDHFIDLINEYKAKQA